MSTQLDEPSRTPQARQDKRRQATLRFAPELTQIVLRAGSSGATPGTAARAMAAKQGFTQTLRDQRMTFRQFVDGHGFIVGRGPASRVFAPQRTQDNAATLMRFAAGPA